MEAGDNIVLELCPFTSIQNAIACKHVGSDRMTYLIMVYMLLVCLYTCIRSSLLIALLRSELDKHNGVLAIWGASGLICVLVHENLFYSMWGK